MPSASMVMPWARRTWPSPHERRNRPSRSKTMTGCSPRVKQNTLSLASTATPATSTKLQPSGSLPQPSMTWKFMSLLEGPVHALEATAQGLAGLFMGDHVEPVGLHRAEHASRHVLRLEIAADELEPVVVLRPLGIPELRRPVALARPDVRAHPHGAQHGDTDAVRAEIFLEGFGEPHHRVLARVVDAESLRGDEPRHGSGVDDVAGLLLGDHARYEGFHAVDHTPEVHAEHPFPVAMGGGLETAVDGHARVVADHVHRAHLRPRALGQCLHRRELGHVGLDGEGLGSGLADARGGLCHAHLVDISHHDVGAFAGEGERERAADPAPPAGDHRRLTLERFHGISLRTGPGECGAASEGMSSEGRGRRWYDLPPWSIGSPPPSCPSATICGSSPTSPPPPSLERPSSRWRWRRPSPKSYATRPSSPSTAPPSLATAASLSTVPSPSTRQTNGPASRFPPPSRPGNGS